MSINGITAVGDDQKWKLEVERYIKELERRIKVLESQTNARSR